MYVSKKLLRNFESEYNGNEYLSTGSGAKTDDGVLT